MSVAEIRPKETGDRASEMKRVLEKQKAAHLRDGAPSAEKRIEWIDRAINLLVGHKDAIADALREDFGHRSVESSLFTDVSGSIGPLKHAKANLKTWMKREKRKV
ncbi:MAG: coniferyl aldehyde dehydrogenase, partial [Alphaproteobacteria bacterium]|nr:coniferyl aldehyde dehydrogenase [Alphaproteobacteria bacterium]